MQLVAGLSSQTLGAVVATNDMKINHMMSTFWLHALKSIRLLNVTLFYNLFPWTDKVEILFSVGHCVFTLWLRIVKFTSRMVQ